jgi:ketosteroid isomerase-like protein
MAAGAHAALFRRWIDEAWNRGNLAVLEEIIAPGFVRHAPGEPREWRGPAGIGQFITVFRTGLPDLRITVDDVVAAGEKVAYRGTARGTHQGDLMGIAPTGKPVDVTYTVLARVAGGQFQEDWLDFDTLGMLQQVGAVPALGSTGS